MSAATVITPGSVDDRGTDVDDWDNPTRTPEEGWRFTPLDSSEALDHSRRGVIVSLSGIGPLDSVVTAHTRLEVQGVAYEVVGEPQRWPSLTGHLSHTRVVLKHVSG